MAKISLPAEVDSVFLDELRQKLGCENMITNEFLKVSLENVVLFDKKQTDYGPRNISKWQMMGCVVRMSDKVERLANLLGKTRRKPRNESVQDTLRDASNYGIIAMLCELGLWPK